jgi:hypothetical protein
VQVEDVVAVVVIVVVVVVVTNVKVQNIFHGRNNITCSTECKYRTAIQLYTIETWFVSGI